MTTGTSTPTNVSNEVRPDAVVVDGISKRFDDVQALDDVSLTVPKGQVLGLLGHNGAGKTTLVNILATLLDPDAGHASVAGFDVVGAAIEVRRRIGLTGQFAAVDTNITGKDNLVMIGRLLGMGQAAVTRADELLERFNLTEAADRLAKNYSGGMRRRLDIAASLVGYPEVLFLDEPTTGLDPGARKSMWDVVEQLAADGTSVLLTTQYLEEADHLADLIVVLAEGRVVGQGTAAELKAAYGDYAVQVVLAPGSPIDAAMAQLEASGYPGAHIRPDGSLVVPVDDSSAVLPVAAVLDGAGVRATAVDLTQPSLDDVYLHLTGAAVSPDEPAAAEHSGNGTGDEKPTGATGAAA